MSLYYSEYKLDNITIPPPPVNCGLYIGERFNGPWGNVDIVPDVVYFTKQALKFNDIAPPPEAFNQFGNIFRPGNSEPNIVDSNKYEPSQIACPYIPKQNKHTLSDCKSFNPAQQTYLEL